VWSGAAISKKRGDVNKFVVKLFLFFVVLLMTITITQAYITGPIAKQNTDMAMKQFDGVPATAGDISMLLVCGSASMHDITYFIALCIRPIGFRIFAEDVLLPFSRRRRK
jgi:hypothetical protein